MLGLVHVGFRTSLRMRGFRSVFAESSVGRVHAMQAPGKGELPPVVVLHGLSASAGAYRPLLLRLKRVCQRVFAPDLPGHGLSETPESMTVQSVYAGVRDVLQREPEAPFWLIGSSLGGAGAVRFAAEHPERVRGLVLLAPGGAPLVNDDERESFINRCRIRTQAEALDFVDRIFERPPRLRRLYGMGVRASFRQANVQALVDGIGSADFLSSSMLRALSMPTLLIWGPADRLLPPSALAFFQDNLPPHAQIASPEGFGHCPFIDRLDELMEWMVSFMGGAR